jgi:hypothetical protein
MFRNIIPVTCWIPEEPHQGVWNRTIGAGRASERGFTSSSSYKVFGEIDGCSVRDSLWDAGAPGLSGCWVSVFVKPDELERALATIVKLSGALKAYWVSSGTAATAEQCKRDFEE